MTTLIFAARLCFIVVSTNLHQTYAFTQTSIWVDGFILLISLFTLINIIHTKTLLSVDFPKFTLGRNYAI